jgi:hypothetical protein
MGALMSHRRIFKLFGLTFLVAMYCSTAMPFSSLASADDPYILLDFACIPEDK